MQFGMWLGYLTFGYICDAVGRKKTYVVYLLAAAAFIVLYANVRGAARPLLPRPVRRLLRNGLFLRDSGPLTAELYPTRIRATLQGFTYNIGRVVSAIAPLAIGTLAEERGFGTAFLLAAAAFVAAAAMWTVIPETRGRALE